MYGFHPSVYDHSLELIVRPIELVGQKIHDATRCGGNGIQLRLRHLAEDIFRDGLGRSLLGATDAHSHAHHSRACRRLDRVVFLRAQDVEDVLEAVVAPQTGLIRTPAADLDFPQRRLQLIMEDHQGRFEVAYIAQIGAPALPLGLLPSPGGGGQELIRDRQLSALGELLMVDPGAGELLHPGVKSRHDFPAGDVHHRGGLEGFVEVGPRAPAARMGDPRPQERDKCIQKNVAGAVAGLAILLGESIPYRGDE